MSEQVETGKADFFGIPDADGWYTWEGSGMLRPAGMVEIVWRNGMKAMVGADELEWRHFGAGGDIVKWCPAPPFKIGKRANTRCCERFPKCVCYEGADGL